jgi:integrase
MASIFKRRRVINRRKVQAKRYTIQYIDAHGKTRRVTGFTDKGKSWDLARKLEAGAADGDYLKHRKTHLVDHLLAYKQHLEAQNDTPKHVSQTEKRIKQMIEGCGFERIRDVNLPDLEHWLAEQRREKVFAIRTSNYYARDFKGFFNWLVDANRAESNPLAKFSPLNAETDKRRERRAIEFGDFAKLIAATIDGDPYRGIPGVDRAVLYVVSAYTGLRVSELASLTSESFDLEACVVTVDALISKRRRRDRQPLKPDLAALLGRWLPGRTGPLWPGTWSEDAAAMLRLDLPAAGIPYVDATGRFYDFHSLRHQFISNMARSDVPAKVAQVLARHSTIQLTLDTYAHLVGDDATAALERLPAIPTIEWTQNRTQPAVLTCQNVSQADTTVNADTHIERGFKFLPGLNLSQPVASCYGNAEVRPAGIEPATCGLEVRCSIQLSYGRVSRKLSSELTPCAMVHYPI